MSNSNIQRFQQFTQHLTPANNLSSFIYTNALLRSAGQFSHPLLHFWTLKDTVILGLKDQRLPHLQDALQLLTHRNQHYFMRNSGGLAVVSDDGILNLSIFYPWHLLGHELSIDEAYQQMVNLIQTAFPKLNLSTGEISHSYCPGSFDISVNGQKIGGISQRRNKFGVVVMLYLSVCGNQQQRGALIRDFYDAGLQNAVNKWHFPDVWPTAMTTVEQVLQSPLTVTGAIQQIKNSCELLDNTSLNNLMWSPNFITTLNKELTSMNQLQERLRKED
ncbi:lipoate--protein ligase family protein [Limosilactobacillus sp. STM2_1]|uniref:Lipoate--protein ligase family protein n=1 Tax=Limosilactobacillus rudii TaxID=2759755 RepID=A0A7W3YP25_9LACO|nr:lipoate--protein ligase family protein [Limosilactobacillus rudii]MBB1079004.1 lipoate--protein ligase family protein [Limosilactobacillus rudii]MBB1098310.1 lipoate--protein ligase family protein [Limosilactobacillus rudii]MCD7135318.1 lipoate--protein ligase family protein [Limosilactobacillus rudii]